MGENVNELPWFKFYTEALHDTKFRVIANDNRMQTWQVMGIWASLLCIAANSPIRGTLAASEKRGLGIEDLKSILEWDDNYWEGDDLGNIIKSFMELDMIVLDDFGSYKIKNFEERQETKEERANRLHAERQKRYANKQTSVITDADTDANNDADVTQDSISISISNSLSDSDSLSSLIDEKEEIDKSNWGFALTQSWEEWGKQELTAINRGKKELAEKYRPDPDADWKTIDSKTHHLKFELRKVEK